ERRRTLPLAELERKVTPDARRRERFTRALATRELAFVCELKRRSPSAGLLLLEPERWRALAESYRAGGASALSVLTEQDHFAGSLDDLRAAELTGLPLLRKDFVLDEAMVLESALHGADCVLLIAAILEIGRASCRER